MQGVGCGEQGPTVVVPGKEHRDEDAAGAGAGRDVEHVGNAGGWVAGTVTEGGLEPGEGDRGEEGIGGAAAAVDGQDPDPSSGTCGGPGGGAS